MRTGPTLLTAIFTLRLFTGCASEPVPPERVIHEQADAMRTALTKAIGEPARRAELLAQVDQLELVLKEQNDDLSHLAHELQALNADYDAPRTRFDDALARFRERVAARFDRVQTVHFAMVGRMDAKEWKQVVELEHAALEAAGTPDVQAFSGGKS